MALKPRRVIARITCLMLLGLTAWAGEARVCTFRLNGLDIGVDCQTGSVIRLASSATGVILDGAPESAGLLEVAYPVDSFAPMRLSTRFSTAVVAQHGKEVMIKWDKLGASRGGVGLPPGQVSAQVIIKAADDGRSVSLQCRLENKSSNPIPQVLFPDLWGLKPFAGVSQTQLRFARGVVQPFQVPFRAPDSSPPFYAENGWQEYPAGGYYNLNALRWLDYGSLRGGLSVFQKKWGTPDAPNVLTWRSEAEPMSLRLIWEHKTTLEPGETWESGEFWLTPHAGGWAKGIEAFREYVKKVSPATALPPHVRDGSGFQTIWMTLEPETDPAKVPFRFADIPRVAADASAHGINELNLWFPVKDATLPLAIHTELGSFDELLAGVRKARQFGVNVAPFISIHYLVNSCLGRYGVKPGNEDWNFHTELIPQFRPYYLNKWYGGWVDSGNKLWQQDVLDNLSDWIDRGITSVSWDQFSWNPVKDEKPDLVSLIEKVRSRARAKDPESTFSAESLMAGGFEYDGEVVDYTWDWVDYVDAGPLLNVLQAPRLNCNVEDSPLVVKKAFSEDLYLNVMPKKPDRPNGTALINEKPALAAALKQVASLRKLFLPYFTHGTHLGESILSEPPSAFVRGYQLGDKLLIIILNDHSAAEYVTVHSDLPSWFPSAASCHVKYYDGSGELLETTERECAHWYGTTRRLEPSELSFLEIETR